MDKLEKDAAAWMDSEMDKIEARLAQVREALESLLKSPNERAAQEKARAILEEIN